MFDPRNGVETMFKAWGALAIVISCFVVRTTAHEHHMDKIEEGQAVSADPIVCSEQKRDEYRSDANRLVRIQYYGFIYSYRRWLGACCFLRE